MGTDGGDSVPSEQDPRRDGLLHRDDANGRPY
jgi:hypothetical protein